MKLQESLIFYKKTRLYLEQHYYDIVDYIRIGVNPVMGEVEKLLNVADTLQFKKRMNKYKIKSLLHPFAIIYYKNKNIEPVIYERLSRISIEPLSKIDKLKNDYIISDKIHVNKTLGNLYQNHMIYVGGYDNIIIYNPAFNNSQHFIARFLESNGLLTDKIKKFFKQPTEAILRGFEATNLLISRLIYLDVKLDAIINGSGFEFV